jgi:tetratricopeptide (TPR) repeat protein
MRGKNMDMTNRPWSARRSWAPYRVILPGIAGVLMLVSSIFPWFNDPVGTPLTAWQIPVDLGWQLRFEALNYGTLCTCCALYIFFVSRQAWSVYQARRNADPSGLIMTSQISPTRCYRQAGLLCLIPSLLFLFQFLVVDMGMIAEITGNQIQLELARSHFGYASAPEFIPILPFSLHQLHMTGRATILSDQAGIGLFMPVICTLIMLMARSFLSRSQLIIAALPQFMRRRRRIMLCGAVLLALILLGRAPAALASEYQAEHMLNIGNYANALSWLDRAQLLNPSFDMLPEYHIKRGQALYFQHPRKPDVESKTFLGNYYLTQNDVYTSYQVLKNVWNTYPHTTWLRDEMSLTLAQLAETRNPLKGIKQLRLIRDEPALPWLDEILSIDQNNFYAQFTAGRILCELHNYAACEAHMRMVLNINKSFELQSAAYTYIAISKFGLGDFSNAREYLYKAQDFDPTYHNNTARQYMSGMR